MELFKVSFVILYKVTRFVVKRNKDVVDIFCAYIVLYKSNKMYSIGKMRHVVYR